MRLDITEFRRIKDTIFKGKRTGSVPIRIKTYIGKVKVKKLMKRDESTK